MALCVALSVFVVKKTKKFELMTPQTLPWLLVFLGGGAGSIARYALSVGLGPIGGRWPLATLAANALACLILGWVLAATPASDTRRWLLATGFCGGFSTFSTFTAETTRLMQNGQTGAALLNVTANLAFCFFFLWVGAKLAQ